MPRDAVFCVVPDTRGFLWLCTAEGLSWFDGYRFNNYGVAQGLAHRSVNAVLQAADGSLLAATDGGLSRLDPSAAPGSAKFRTIPADAGLPTGIFDVIQDPAGVVWGAGYDGIFRLDHPSNPTSRLRFVPVTDGAKLAVTALAADPSGNLWLGTTHGLARRRAGGSLDWPSGISADGIQALLVDRQDRLWVGTMNGLWRFAIRDGSLRLERAFHKPDGLSSERIHRLYQSSSGTIWVGTASSLAELWVDPDGHERFRNYSEAEGLKGRRVTAIGEDRGGDLWVGVDNGLSRVARGGFITASQREGIGRLAIATLMSAPDEGLIALSTETRFVFHRLEKERFVSIVPRLPMHYLGWGWDQVALHDRAGDLWIATGEGVVRYSHLQSLDNLATAAPTAIYTMRDGLAGNDIFRIFEDSRGDVWIGPLSGAPSVWRRSAGRFEHLPRASFPGTASAFAEDRSGGVWIGVSNESATGQPSVLIRYRRGRIERFAAGAAPGWISSLLIDRQGRLWIATADAGLGLIADPASAHPHFEPFPLRLSSVTTRCLAEDRAGRVWVGTARGLDRVNASTGEVRHFDSANGYQGGACSALRVDSSGALWAGSSSGLSRFLPGDDAAEAAPEVFVTALSIRGELTPGAEQFPRQISLGRLAPHLNQMHIEFSSPAKVEGRAIRYEYRLEGTGGGVEPTDQRAVDFPLLSSGRYRFAVTAVDETGRRSPAPAVVIFEILPPLWARWWFIALIVCAAAAAIHGVYRLKLSKQLEVERLRARIAADLHDDLGASLSRVVIMSESVRLHLDRNPEESRERLGEIASAARGMVDGMSDLVWSIDPRKDDMRSLLRRLRQFASDVLESQGIDWRLDAQPGLEDLSLDAGQRRHLFLILKEAIANAARHAQCSQVSIRAEASGGELMISVADDGRGFDEAAAKEGNGLENMRRRAQALGGSLVLDGRQGVRVLLRFPLSHRR